MCQTLKNRSRDVRDTGRDTLVKMACALGPKYLRYIVKEMKEMLNRGYMVCVSDDVYTMYDVHAPVTVSSKGRRKTRFTKYT